MCGHHCVTFDSLVGAGAEKAWHHRGRSLRLLILNEFYFGMLVSARFFLSRLKWEQSQTNTYLCVFANVGYKKKQIEKVDLC